MVFFSREGLANIVFNDFLYLFFHIKLSVGVIFIPSLFLFFAFLSRVENVNFASKEFYDFFFSFFLRSFRCWFFLRWHYLELYIRQKFRSWFFMSIVSNVSAAAPSITLLDSIQNIKRGREKSNWNCFAFSRASNQIATRPGEQFFYVCVLW